MGRRRKKELEEEYKLLNYYEFFGYNISKIDG